MGAMRKSVYRFCYGLFLMCSLNASANSLPELVTRDLMGLAVRGGAVMRFIGLKVYDVRLWTPMKPFTYADPFVVELVYNMSFSGKDIADRSVQEMRAQGVSDEKKLKRWGDEMAKIFPDIKQGDTLIGVSLPGKEARFYNREKLIATVPDPGFAKAFFDIGLSEKTTEPTLRVKLLGEQ